MARILIVEDEPDMAKGLRFNLEARGFEVDVAVDGDAGLRAATTGSPDLVVLDVMMPKRDGYDVCRGLRAESNVPIIVLTARSDELDRVLGLELGADDYVVKPFGFRELVARIRAVARRAHQGPTDGSSTITVGDVTIDRRSHTVTHGGAAVSLTPKEYDLLVYLATDPGAVKARDQLMHDVWDVNWWGSTKTLDVHVASLRKKLHPDLIETVRSIGYRLVDPHADR